MAERPISFRIEALVKGTEGVEKLKNSVRRLQNTATPAAKDITNLRLAANLLGRHTHRTTNDIKTQIAVLHDLRNNVRITGDSYKQLSEDIKKAERELAKVQGTAGKGRGGLGATAGIVGGAALLGPDAAVGAGIGGLLGGPAGAAAGVGVGNVVLRPLREAMQASAEYAAQVARLEIALRGVTKNSFEFARAQDVIASVSRELNIPIDIATKQFTTLSASVIGAGGNVGDAEIVFRGVSEAIKATGGEAHDVQSAIRAMSQIFGKGKVSAEELQGQLGERLPGAVVKFANATGRTLPQLQKDLRDGTVGLNDVMKFAVKLSEDHRDAALEMAGSTEEAGQRMTVALKDLQRNFGNTFKPAGAMIQNLIADLADLVNALYKVDTATQMMKELGIRGGMNKERDKLVNHANRMATAIMQTRGSQDSSEYKKVFNEIFTGLLKQLMDERGLNIKPSDLTGKTDFPSPISKEGDKQLNEQLEKRKQHFEDLRFQAGEITKEKYEQILANRELLDWAKKLGIESEEELKRLKKMIEAAKERNEGIKGGVKGYLDSIKPFAEELADVVEGAFGKMEDALVDFIMTGKLEFGSLIRSILADLARLHVRQNILGPIVSALGNSFGLNTNTGGGTTGGKALGGPVVGGAPVLVGEQGPEIFTPTGNGTITSNHDLVMDRYRPTGSASTAGTSAEEGGSFSTGGAAVIDVNYHVESINSIDYVTVAQFQQGMSQAAKEGAKKGEQATLHKLQTSSSTRRRVGV